MFMGWAPFVSVTDAPAPSSRFPAICMIHTVVVMFLASKVRDVWILTDVDQMYKPPRSVKTLTSPRTSPIAVGAPLAPAAAV